MTLVTQSFMPVEAVGDFIFHDTDWVGPNLVTPFFQSPGVFLHGDNKGGRKTFEAHTNMFAAGCLPEGYAMDVDSIRVVMLHDQADEVSARLVMGASVVLETRLRSGEWSRVRTTDLPHAVALGVVPGGSRPLFIDPLRSFGFQVMHAPKACEAVFEIRGTLWRPDFESELYASWRANKVLDTARGLSTGCLAESTDADGDGMFDTEMVNDGKARMFEAMSRRDGSSKMFAEDMNFMTSGGIPRGHLKCVTGVSVVLPQGLPKGLHQPANYLVHLTINGHWTIHLSVPVDGQVALEEPVFLLPGEHLSVEVHASKSLDGEMIRVTLQGPHYASKV